MPGIRLVDQKPQYRKADGTLAAFGTIYFYETGTTTPKDVYGEIGLSTNLGPEISLDADGRHSEDVFLNDDAAYRIDVRDSGDASIPGYPLDDVGGASTGSANIPDPSTASENQVWSGDGLGGADWRDVRELASGTGHEGEVWYSDGTDAGGYYAPLPEAEVFDEDNLPGGITQPSTGVATIGDEQIVRGSDTAPTNGTLRVTKAVTFPAAFASAPCVVVTATIGGVTGDSPAASVSAQATNITTAGFTAEFFAGAEANSPDTDITSAVTFNYIAMGPKVSA